MKYTELLELCKQRFWMRKSIIERFCSTCEYWKAGQCYECAYHYEIEALQCPACVIARYQCSKCLVIVECIQASRQSRMQAFRQYRVV